MATPHSAKRQRTTSPLAHQSRVLVLSHPNTHHHTGHTSSRDSSGEKPERTMAILTYLAKLYPVSHGLLQPPTPPQVVFDSNPPRAQLRDLWRVHDVEYIGRIIDQTPKCGGRSRHFSPGRAGVKTTFLSPGSTEAILRAAGAVTTAIDTVLASDSNITTAFCVVRPPGHHCGWSGVEPLDTDIDLAQGFCYVNNVMVGAAYAVHEYDTRVAILDFDVHHGNGTEGIMRRLLSTHPPEIPFPLLFISTHQYSPGFYPGTGSPHPSSSPYSRHIINIPLARGTSSAEFRKALKEQALTALRDFAPTLILISAGFDSHAEDHVGDLDLVDEDFQWISMVCKRIQKKIVSVLEGGYLGDTSESCLVRSCAAHIKGLLDEGEDSSKVGS
ncbi:uncharacterized protein SPPG_08304 [Spizellomyces punctatus DAOM BR117]|uniref:histone deacetylase n=1 Tax=Spizellomyces punctatus (strain DAOM BR117) TaxID=645134 RepID=A0A0L0H4G7_SPIPD|nr:uncharacterized protein SPPG_08304 [Spizellomyces punctatus DAOM BR117]KNC96405.1 hypothetical protein SPPG_08304 [Spizellomyces punctatus DAOM BR117]|eukprot:XP_016604445.1 hypothetical protein SPPG_08304 [Spizellomyces punctatus DAOM BR117]